MKLRALGSVALALALALGATGCIAALFGAGTVAGAGALVWQSGWLRGNMPEPIERVQRAAKSALGDYKAKIESDSLKPPSGKVDATLPDGRRVVVETRVVAGKETQVRIRVGFWGDQATSLNIFEQIKKHL